MPLFRRVLVGVVSLAVLPPLLMWFLAAFGRGTMLSLLHSGDSPDSRTIGLYFGMAAGGVGAVGLLAAAWIAQGRPEGLTLAQVIGLSKGLLVAVLAGVARRQEAAARTTVRATAAG
jgi:hypothetical protein